MRLTAPALGLGGLLILASPLSAQTIIAWDATSPFGPIVFDQIAAVSPAYPNGAAIGPPFSGLGALSPTGPTLGGMAIDNVTGIIYASDGTLIESQAFPHYPAPGPPAPGVFPYAGPTGPIQGMTIDPHGDPAGGPLLWVTDGSVVAGVAPVTGTPVLVPPFPVVGPVPVQFPPLVGLDWDPYGMSLWAVDVGGLLYNFAVGGAFLGYGPPGPTVLPISAPPPAGLAIDRSGPGAGFYVSYAGLSGVIVRYGTPAMIISAGAATQSNGLSFHALPARLPGAANCILGAHPPALLRTLGGAWSGHAGFGLTLDCVPPGVPVALAADLETGALLPQGIPFAYGTLYLDPALTPTMAILPLGHVPASGTLTLQIPLVGPGGAPVPPGIRAYLQVVAAECGVAPYFSISDALQIQVSLP